MFQARCCLVALPQACWSASAVHSSYGIISISRSASIDAASSEISLFLSDYRRKRVCTARPCCCMTNGSRCALPVCHKPHMTHPSDTAMHARRLREPLQYILWQYKQHTVTPPLDFPQETQTSTARAVCSRCVLALCALALDRHRMGVYCTDTRPCKAPDDCGAGCCC